MNGKMIWVGMYADQTRQFTEEELYVDNWVEVKIPEWIVRKWYEKENLAEETAYELNIDIKDATFERWLNEVSYGDDTDGLYEFAVANGFTPKVK